MAQHTHKDIGTRQSLLALVNVAGFSVREAGRRLRVPASTAQRWVRLSREGIEN
ncbi:hypothetical protein L9F63_026886, partial [Diploptera punctata]